MEWPDLRKDQGGRFDSALFHHDYVVKMPIFPERIKIKLLNHTI